jgi:hypothetical protein
VNINRTRLRAALPDPVLDRLRLYQCRWNRRNPRTFNEKLLYKMVWDRRELVVTFADKVAAKEYVASRIGPGYTARTLRVTNDLTSVDLAELPPNFVVKNAHLSGGVVVVFDGADPSAELPSPDDVHARTVVTRERLDWQRLAEISARWIATTYSTDPCGEWMYQRVPPAILIEELLTTPDHRLPDDVRFFVFNGRCRLVRVASGVVGGGKTIDDFRPDWTPVEAQYIEGHPIPRAAVRPQRPARLDEMIRLAETLAAETDFLRVDMFLLGDRIVVGELTNFPAAGIARWDPPDLAWELGRSWRLPLWYGRWGLVMGWHSSTAKAGDDR